jgi:hypothetical protein
MATGDGELVREEGAAEEVLMSEAMAVSSSLEWVLDVAAGMTVLWVGSDGNGGGSGGACRRVEVGKQEWSRGENGAAWS